MKVVGRYFVCALMFVASLPLPGSAMVVCLGTDHLQVVFDGKTHGDDAVCAASGSVHEHAHHEHEQHEHVSDGCGSHAGHDHQHETIVPSCFCIDVHVHVPELAGTWNPESKQVTAPVVQPSVSFAVVPGVVRVVSWPPVQARPPNHLSLMRTVQILC